MTVGEKALVGGEATQAASERGLIESVVLVITIERDEQIITPKGETKIQSSTLIRALSRHGLSDDTMHQLTGEYPHSRSSGRLGF